MQALNFEAKMIVFPALDDVITTDFIPTIQTFQHVGYRGEMRQR